MLARGKSILEWRAVLEKALPITLIALLHGVGPDCREPQHALGKHQRQNSRHVDTS